MNYIDKIKEEFEGREIYICDISGTDGKRINFDQGNVSLCHEHVAWKPQEVRSLASWDTIGSEIYYERIYDLMKKMQSPDFPCRKCEACQKKIFHFTPIPHVILGLSLYCNSRCIYCAGHTDEYGEDHDIIPVLKRCDREGMFAKDAWFDWGGGEPTQHTHYEDAVRYLMKKGYRQRVNTNAIVLSKATMEMLKEGMGTVRVSPDSGTPAVFRRMKGNDSFHAVWTNIEKYCEANPEEVEIKYNICNYNSDKEEMDAFLDMCKKSGVLRVSVEGEANSYQKEKNVGPFYFRKKEFEAAHYLYNKARELGFRTTVSEYAFLWHAEYDENHVLQLPSVYRDNIDAACFSHGLYVEAFPTTDMLLDAIRELAYPVVICGAGKNGRKAIKMLRHENISSVCIDNNESIRGTIIDGVEVQYAVDYLAEPHVPSIYLLTPDDVQPDMVKQLNDAGVEGELYYINFAAYDHYMNSLEKIERRSEQTL